MIADSIVRQNVLRSAEKEIKFIEQNSIKAFYFLNDDYPSRLKHFPDCPPILYYKGNANLNADRTIAVIGTRTPTPRGIAKCEEIVAGLQAYNPLVISGLAYGIDIAAHRKCLSDNLRTIGVVGHGLNLIYPYPHRKTAEEMATSGGILTEYPSNTLPDGRHFPMRNRIIAGLSDAVLVIETAEKGGSIITANIANSYHKDVFAIPGRSTDSFSSGCNLLIKSHKAALVENVEDIVYNLNWSCDMQPTAIQGELFMELTDEEKVVLELLKPGDVFSIDRLTYESSITNSGMAALLLNLEFKGLIKSLPGKRYMLA